MLGPTGHRLTGLNAGLLEAQRAGDPGEDIGYTGAEHSKDYNNDNRNQNNN